jgi:ketosteroid isomerase-like protein
MTEHENVRLIKEHFAAFGRGDVKSALGIVAENVDWQSPVTRSQPEEITWAAPRHSREEVLQFFQELADKVQPEKFEIIGFIAQDDKVVVEGAMSMIGSWCSLCATAKSYDIVITTILQMWQQRF